MSVKQKIQEDFFTCVICQEVFNDPVTLHCTHNFCANCLTSFTKTKPEAVTRGFFPCPSCRQLTNVPDPTRPVEDWAGQLKTGFFVKGLMEALGTMDMASEDSDDKHHCSICKNEGKKTPASVLCTDCNVFVCESCKGKHNTTHSLNDVKEERKGSGKFKRKCKTHPEKDLELYCSDCKRVICVLCCSINHRKCNDVKTVEDAAEAVKPKLKEKETEVKCVLDYLKAKSESKRQQLDQLSLAFAKADEEIDKTAQSVIEAVLSKAANLKKEAHAMKENQCGNLLGDIKSVGIKIENYEKDEASIEAALKSPSDVELVEVYNGLSKIIASQPIDPDEDASVEFEGFGQRMIESLESFDLGRLHFGKKPTSTVDIQTAGLHFKEVIDIQIPEDEDTPFLRDVLTVSLSDSDVIIVADSENKCVKSFYGKSNHSYLQLPASPCKMTKVRQTQGAVTLSNKSVLIFSCNPAVKRSSVFRTQKNYYGIAWLGNATFAMGGLSPACIDIIDMTGNILKSLSHFTQEGLVFWDFQTPVFLCATPSCDIVVSDYSTRQVTVLNKELEIVHKFPRLMPQEEGTLRNPLGVACSRNGNIFVVDRSREVVIQLTAGAQFIRNVLTPKDGLEGETCIFVDEKDQLFLAVANRCVKKFCFET